MKFISCEWGINALSISADVIVIVDVLSFSTCVDIVINNSSDVYPYQYKDESAQHYAIANKAYLAGPRDYAKYSLSPFSLLHFPNNNKLVLPSPNGSTLAFKATAKHVLCGCLRNARAVAAAAMNLGKHILIVPAGEKWPDDTLKVSYEDMIGAGAIIAELQGDKTAEASIAEAVFYHSEKDNSFKNIYNLKSGVELIALGFEKDIDLACEYNVSQSVPYLKGRCFTNLL